MKKLLFVSSLSALFVTGALQLFASPSMEECIEQVYSCESACDIDFPNSPWQVCMEWCVPSDCHSYI